MASDCWPASWVLWMFRWSHFHPQLAGQQCGQVLKIHMYIYHVHMILYLYETYCAFVSVSLWPAGLGCLLRACELWFAKNSSSHSCRTTGHIQACLRKKIVVLNYPPEECMCVCSYPAKAALQRWTMSQANQPASWRLCGWVCRFGSGSEHPTHPFSTWPIRSNNLSFMSPE